MNPSSDGLGNFLRVGRVPLAKEFMLFRGYRGARKLLVNKDGIEIILTHARFSCTDKLKGAKIRSLNWNHQLPNPAKDVGEAFAAGPAISLFTPLNITRTLRLSAARYKYKE